jgi:hypothetical protein
MACPPEGVDHVLLSAGSDGVESTVRVAGPPDLTDIATRVSSDAFAALATAGAAGAAGAARATAAAAHALIDGARRVMNIGVRNPIRLSRPALGLTSPVPGSGFPHGGALVPALRLLSPAL